MRFRIFGYRLLGYAVELRLANLAAGIMENAFVIAQANLRPCLRGKRLPQRLVHIVYLQILGLIPGAQENPFQ